MGSAYSYDGTVNLLSVFLFSKCKEVQKKRKKRRETERERGERGARADVGRLEDTELASDLYGNAS